MSRILLDTLRRWVQGMDQIPNAAFSDIQTSGLNYGFWLILAVFSFFPFSFPF